jgi:hypothetical protein
VSTEWFTKEAGSDVAVGTDDPSMALIGAGVPDWVRLPPDLGGQRVRVLAASVRECPRGPHEVRHLKLDGDISVAECEGHGGFLWYRTPQEAS